MRKISEITRVRRGAAVLAVAAVLGGGAIGIAKTTNHGGDPPAVDPLPASTTAKPAVPRALSSAESAAEDIVDLALADKRGEVVAKARELKRLADGAAGRGLVKVGVSDERVGEFRARAARVEQLAPRAQLIDVALASNRTFALMPGFFARYDVPTPVGVIRLDYLDFEAKLRSIAGDVPQLQRAVRGLELTWSKVRPVVVASGGAAEAATYDRHVQAMNRLQDNADPSATQREAQRGLDLVDLLEGVFMPR